MNGALKKNWRLELYQLFNLNPDMKEPDYTSLLMDRMGSKNMPSLSSIQKELVKLRKIHRDEIKNPGKNTTWHLGTLSEYPMSPAGVAKVYEFITKGSKIKPDLKLPTVRTALWMDRLSSLPLSITCLYRFSLLYSLMEVAVETYPDDYSLTPTTDSYIFDMMSNNPEELLKENWGKGFDEVTPEQAGTTLGYLAAIKVEKRMVNK